MKARTTTTRSHYLTIPEAPVELEAPCCLSAADEYLVTPLPNGGWDIVTAVPDDDPEYAWVEWDDPSSDPASWSNGCFRDFRHDGGPGALVEFYGEMVEAVGADRVFHVEVYSHGLESFSRVGQRWYPDREWDVCASCVLAVPPDATNPEEYADAVLSTYTDVCNGNVWTIVWFRTDADGRLVHQDAMGGHVGYPGPEDLAWYQGDLGSQWAA
jgi:hypothetical protein